MVELRFGFLLAATLSLAWAHLAAAQSFTIELELRGKKVEGSPLHWSDHEVHLLGRDGYLWEFAPTEAASYRRISSSFSSLSQAEVRGQLLEEFGPAFDVSGTGHYLVVHPAGQRDKWARRFEDLYRSFVRYFAARGFRPQPPQFPLIAVVFPDQRDFRKHAWRTGSPLPSGTLGYYCQVSNRIFLFDVTAGQAEDHRLWHVNAETIIHEAAHQSAFNTGIHRRFAPPPAWVVEGIGTLFEAPGVWNPREFPSRSDRVNQDRLAAFRKYVARRPVGSLAAFVSDDRLFSQDVEAAYAQAWALTFFLSETEPRKYITYLRRTTQREDFSTYLAEQRLRDFSDVFGPDLGRLEMRFLHFMRDVQ